MKKNRMMRLASGLLVAVLATTSMISGTYAKYVTTADGTDKARVAKWGVDVAVEGADLFAKAYDNTVESTVDDLVAPGTKNDQGIKFTLKGQPEVDVKVAVTVTAEDGTSAYKDVFLKAGSYANVTTGNDKTDIFTFTEDYYPVVFTLKNGAGTILKTGNLSAIVTYLTGLAGNYDANTDLAGIVAGSDGTYVLTWEWAYGELDGISDNDKKDTLLGDLAVTPALEAKGEGPAFGAMAAGTDYCNNIEFKVAITVTQID